MKIKLESLEAVHTHTHTHTSTLNNKNSKGITLVALVVTIVVLLILAGVSINLVLGQNGLITQAKEAKEKTKSAEVNETEDPVNASIFIEKTSNENSFSAARISKSSSEEIKNIYGAEVKGYDCENKDAVEKWKILYSDGSNIYLIADDAIKGKYMPATKNGNKPECDQSEIGASFVNVINDYTGSVDIKNDKIKGLNKSYFYDHQYVSEGYNMKATAYMLDSEIWSKFKGDKAEFAIGGPTIEMVFKSYNAKYPNSQYNNGKYQASAETEEGYYISVDGGANWKSYTDNASDYFNIEDPLYIKNRNYWLASPAGGPEWMMVVVGIGSVGGNLYNIKDMFRPVVCLKENVTLIKNEDGTFSIN